MPISLFGRLHHLATGAADLRHREMRAFGAIVVAIVALGIACAPVARMGGTKPVSNASGIDHGTALINGHWFDGTGFTDRTMYVVADTFRTTPPSTIDSISDLHAGYVVPPFGDAHTHHLDGLRDTQTWRDKYVTEGTFYVQVLTNTTTGAKAVRDQFNRPGALDVSYANGGLTSTFGHPSVGYEGLAMGLPPSTWNAHMAEIRTSRKAEGNAYWLIDTPADLDAKWPSIVATHPDLIKVYLLDSKNYANKVANKVLLFNGLDPALVPAIVVKAHAAHLRVWAHVETAYDFSVALHAGVDGFAHLPGYESHLLGYELRKDADRTPYLIADGDAQLAGQRGVVATPTAGLAIRDDTGATLALVQDIQRRNIRLLSRYGVRIAVGSDQSGPSGSTARPEVEGLRALGLWDNRALLAMWSEVTPRAIFPGRRIGRLADGYEASYLVLGCNPIASFDCTMAIQRRVKQGRPVALAAPP